MKKDWVYKKLGDVATYVNGYAFKPEQWSTSGLPIIRIQNLNNPDAPYNYFEGSIPKHYYVFKGDLLISWSASLGTYIWDGDNALLNQHIFKVVLDKSDIDKYYLKYAVQSKLEVMSRLVHGATMKHIVKKDFDDTVIPVPSIEEQKAICSLLDKMNRVIEAKKEQLKELDNLAQAIFYDMFGEPEENYMGLEVKELGKLCEVISGYAFPSSDFAEDNPIKAIKITNVGVGTFVFDNTSLPQKYSNLTSFKANQGDIAIALTRTVISSGLKRAIVPIEYDNSLVNQRVAVLKCMSLAPSVLYYYLGTDYVRNYVIEHATALMQPNLSITDLRKMPTPIPPLPLQQAFAEKVKAIERQKELINQSIKDVQTLFDAKMDYYFGD